MTAKGAGVGTEVITVAALYIEEGGVYSNLPGVDAWGISRDARKYAGPHPVIAHPPCERWGRYWSGGPNPKAARRKLGDDDGCFSAAVMRVQDYGGVLEHPAASHAWAYFGLPKPDRDGGWTMGDEGWVAHVEQGHYGHRARKATWLYVVSRAKPTELIWGPAIGERLDEGFHSKAERDAARAAGVPPRKRLSARENLRTPVPFRDLLLSIARSARDGEGS